MAATKAESTVLRPFQGFEAGGGSQLKPTSSQEFHRTVPGFSFSPSSFLLVKRFERGNVFHEGSNGPGLSVPVESTHLI